MSKHVTVPRIGDVPRWQVEFVGLLIGMCAIAAGSVAVGYSDPPVATLSVVVGAGSWLAIELYLHEPEVRA